VACCRNKLLGKTHVPVELPLLVFQVDPRATLYASLDSVDANEYSVSFSHDTACQSHACFAGYVSGEVASGDIDTSNSVVVEPVRLANGAHAIIVSKRCGADCEPPSITWDQGQFRYSVSLHTGHHIALIAMANSMATYK